ncbi:beta-1,3-galactosyltransferase 5-like [Oscarella lobularis]|uniref:beta-1,3-galactosyltransferase 5-like n=1 Tax=Oscarella lobularis TaxID=121494 RepID=UPI003313E124
MKRREQLALVVLLFALTFAALLYEANFFRVPIQTAAPANSVDNSSRSHDISFSSTSEPCRSDLLSPKHARFFSPTSDPCKHLSSSPAFCSDESSRRDVYLFTLIMSAAENFQRRDLLRKTWLRSRFGFSTGNPFNCTYAFVLGRDAKDESVNDAVEVEKCLHKDILTVDAIESYWNLTRKKVAAFDWIQSRFRFNFILKTDDDVFVNVRRAIDWLTHNPIIASSQGKSIYAGYCILYRMEVNRNPVLNKFALTKSEYAGDKFPPYCWGVGYFLSYDVFLAIQKVVLRDVQFKIEDIHTGLLIDRVRGIHVRFVEAKNLISNDVKSCNVLKEPPMITSTARKSIFQSIFAAADQNKETPCA